jgi:hypothetical protein
MMTAERQKYRDIPAKLLVVQPGKTRVPLISADENCNSLGG